MPACSLELAALLFHLPKQPCVLNGESGLRCERAQELRDFRCKAPRAAAAHDESAEQTIVVHQWDGKKGSVAAVHQKSPNATLIERLVRNIGNVDDLVHCSHAAERAFSLAHRHRA